MIAFRFLASTIAFVLFASVTVGAADGVKGLGIGDFRLGMTLTAFRGLAHPHPKQWPKAFAACTGDKKTDEIGTPARSLDLRIDEQARGLVRCEFFFWEEHDDETHFYSSAGLLLGDHALDAQFEFLADTKGAEPRLARIRLQGQDFPLAKAVTELTPLYGKPAKPNPAEWQRGDGKITASPLPGPRDRIVIEFLALAAANKGVVKGRNPSQ